MRKNKGITLIALIITIIMLIILTAITLNNVIGTDLIGFATKAAENYTDAGKDEANAINDIMNIASGIGNGGTGEATPQETLEVKLQVEEAEVKGDTIPIKLEASRNGENVQGVTYTAYLTAEGETEQAGVQVQGDTHTFNDLDQMKDYTIRVVALGQDGVQGENTVTVKALAIKYTTGYQQYEMVYRRYTDGMTWRQWVESEYNHSVGDYTLQVITEYTSSNSVSTHIEKGEFVGVEGASDDQNQNDNSKKGILWLRNFQLYYNSGLNDPHTYSTLTDSDILIPYCDFPSRTYVYSIPAEETGKPSKLPAGEFLSTDSGVDICFNSLESCLAEGTLITLADGSKVPVENLTGNEKVLVYNMYSGKYEASDIAFIVNHSEQSRTRKILHAYFSGGTDIQIIKDHGFFDLDLNKFVSINETNYKDYIGHWFVKENVKGDKKYEKVQLEDVQIETRECKVYEVVTPKNLTCFTNGLLSVASLLDTFCNTFEVDRNTLMYDKELMKKDIEKYGVFSYAEFEDRMSMESFDMLNLQYLKITIGKGIITEEEHSYLRSFYVDNMGSFKSKFNLR